MPEDAGMGLTPARAAKAASERSRPGWDQAVRAMAAVMGPMPVLVRSPAAGVALSRVVMVVRLVASWVSRAVMRWASRMASVRAVAVAMGSLPRGCQVAI